MTVFGDGYQDDVPGPNQDPCIFAECGPIHTFCRIDNNTRNNRVRRQSTSLAATVTPGDLIIYGKWDPPGEPRIATRVWVDVVICVASTPRWSVRQRSPGSSCVAPNCRRTKRFIRSSPDAFAARICGIPDGSQTNAYAFNLRDARSDGAHCCTHVADYPVIVGSCAADPKELAGLATSFIPLAGELDGDPFPTFVEAVDLGERWQELISFFAGEVMPPRDRPNGGWIAEFPDLSLAEDLCGAIVENSGRRTKNPGAVAIPPVMPHNIRGRWDPWNRRVVPDTRQPPLWR